MKRLLYWITSHLPCRIISDAGRPYLERYYLCTVFGIRFYLHRFVDSDPGRGLHDHPWPWAASIILHGWYWEERRGIEKSEIARMLAVEFGTEGIVRNRVRWFNWLLGDNFHRVVLPLVPIKGDGVWYNHTQPCWTLFFHKAENHKRWGFLRKLPGIDHLVYVHHESSTSTWWREVPTGKYETRRMPA